ncbi:MAG: hypothetical protein IT562_04400, partial [Alphaproteobacteria bacterium]|nr:hypothetical protein [Alphaproteobacteria bacterium]
MRRRSLSWDRLILSMVCVLTIAMVSYPVVSVVLRSISKDDIGSELTLQWLAALFESGRSRDALINTIIYA